MAVRSRKQGIVRMFLGSVNHFDSLPVACFHDVETRSEVLLLPAFDVVNRDGAVIDVFVSNMQVDDIRVVFIPKAIPYLCNPPFLEGIYGLPVAAFVLFVIPGCVDNRPDARYFRCTPVIE